MCCVGNVKRIQANGVMTGPHQRGRKQAQASCKQHRRQSGSELPNIHDNLSWRLLRFNYMFHQLYLILLAVHHPSSSAKNSQKQAHVSDESV